MGVQQCEIVSALKHTAKTDTMFYSVFPSPCLYITLKQGMKRAILPLITSQLAPVSSCRLRSWGHIHGCVCAHGFNPPGNSAPHRPRGGARPGLGEPTCSGLPFTRLLPTEMGRAADVESQQRWTRRGDHAFSTHPGGPWTCSGTQRSRGRFLMPAQGRPDADLWGEHLPRHTATIAPLQRRVGPLRRRLV